MEVLGLCFGFCRKGERVQFAFSAFGGGALLLCRLRWESYLCDGCGCYLLGGDGFRLRVCWDLLEREFDATLASVGAYAAAEVGEGDGMG